MNNLGNKMTIASYKRLRLNRYTFLYFCTATLILDLIVRDETI